MQFSSISSRNIAFGVLVLLAILIMTTTFSIKNSILTSVFGVKNVKAYSDIDNLNNLNNYESVNREGFTIREGFTFNTNKDEESIDECINRKLASLKTELGGSKGINDIKKTLNNAKQICDYEATKSMMNLLSANKTTKTINLEDIFNDTDNKDCGRCKDYTQISSKLKDMIDSL